MARRLRSGKAYEHSVLGILTLEGFDVYQPVVDDQGIDGLIRVKGKEGEPPKCYELQVKGSRTWNGIRCKVRHMTMQGVLILYCAGKREHLWFLYEELAQLFPAVNRDWGDIFLNQGSVIDLCISNDKARPFVVQASSLQCPAGQAGCLPHQDGLIIAYAEVNNAFKAQGRDRLDLLLKQL